MKGLEIKKNRKKLNLTQAELAIQLGVSLKTVSNYEKGEVIPETKRVLLHNIFKKLNEEHGEFTIESQNKVEDTGAIYHPKENVLNKIRLINDKIKEHKKIITLATIRSQFEKAEHHKEMVELLKEQIELITFAVSEENNDDEL